MPVAGEHLPRHFSLNGISTSTLHTRMLGRMKEWVRFTDINRIEMKYSKTFKWRILLIVHHRSTYKHTHTQNTHRLSSLTKFTKRHDITIHIHIFYVIRWHLYQCMRRILCDAYYFLAVSRSQSLFMTIGNTLGHRWR